MPATAAKTRTCVVCGKPRVRRPDGVCSDCAPGYYGTAARCLDCGDPTRAADRICNDCRPAFIARGNRGINETAGVSSWVQRRRR